MPPKLIVTALAVSLVLASCLPCGAAAETTLTLSIGEVRIQCVHDPAAPWHERRRVYRDALAEALDRVREQRPERPMRDELSLAFVTDRCWPLTVALNEQLRGQSAWGAYSDRDRRLRLILEGDDVPTDTELLRERSLALADPPIPTPIGQFARFHKAPPGGSPAHEGTVWGRIAQGE